VKPIKKTVVSLALAAALVAAFAALRAPAATPPDLEHALAVQRDLAAQRPDDAQVRNDLGNLLLLVGEDEAAEEAYRRALEVAPEMVSARYNLALLLLQTERPRQAQAELDRVLEAEPAHAWAHYQMGVVHDRRGAERRAVKHYSAAFRLDPQLAFPEINPHVIENEHVTAAMLIAYRDLPLVAQVPKTYEQPGRIVSLMVPTPEEATARAAAVATGEAAPGVRPRPTFAPGEGEVDAEGARVLREEDLERGSPANQVTGPGAVYVPVPQGGTRVPIRTYTPPEAQGRQPGALAQPGQPGRERYVPGIPSTGRLELELIPGPGARADEIVPAG
jgi:hypothetical protein